MPKILIIDDNSSVAMALDILFSLYDIKTIYADSPEQGLQLLAEHSIDLVIQDMNFTADTTSGKEGEQLFAEIRNHYPDLPIILLTAWTHLSAAVELIKSGAADYLSKPWDDNKLLATVNNLLELSETRNELNRRRRNERYNQQQLTQRYNLKNTLFSDPATERVIALACQVAASPLPVLITGPNGSGKEKIAQIIQANSTVKSGPFITVNCGALPADLIEAELFGADAGAYTGANKSREGKFEAADQGTLFLDEIGNLPLNGQIKLLRVLETGKFERLGSNRERQVNVRLISATNADLPRLIQEGKFRQDLYYRINAIELQIPALYERPADILPLAEFFLEQKKILSSDARNALLKYRWPGNVRELRNVIQRAELLSQGNIIGINDLNLPALSAVPSTLSEEPQKADIEAALARSNGIIAKAAADLGLSRQALYRRMQRYHIPRD